MLSCHPVLPPAIQKDCTFIHLAGANVGEKRWTPRRKKEIRDSRVLSDDLLCETVARIPNCIQSVVGALATGWYGPGAAVFALKVGTHLFSFSSEFTYAEGVSPNCLWKSRAKLEGSV